MEQVEIFAQTMVLKPIRSNVFMQDKGKRKLYNLQRN